MDKKEVCSIVDNIEFLLIGYKACIKDPSCLDNVLSIIRNGLNLYINPITRIIVYFRELEKSQVEDNIDIYIVRNTMNRILNTILEKGDNLTITDCEYMYNLISINKNFLHKDDEQYISLEDRMKQIHSELDVNYPLKIIIIDQLHKKTNNFLMYISRSDLESSNQRIVINSNDYTDTIAIYEKIIDIYGKRKLCMEDLLNRIEIRGLTINQIVSLYAKLYQIEDHIVTRITKDSIINLAYVGNKI